MKILAVVSAIDLSLKQAVPAWWQLLKGLYELGVDVVVTPYVGRGVESLWWKSYKNPCETLSVMVNKIVRRRQYAQGPESLSESRHDLGERLKGKTVRLLTRELTSPRWRRHLTQILSREGDVDATIFFNVPLNQISGIPTFVRKKFGVPTIFYDMDAPDSLPNYSPSRLAFNWYVGADLSEYDSFVVNSEGVISELREMGACRVFAIHFGVDPKIYCPISMKKDIDVFFYGQGAQFREKWINCMITEPSKVLRKSTFLVGGRPFNIDLGKAKSIEDIPISFWRRYCCRSKINLNITRKHHAEVYCSSTSRIFELASLGCCIVSNPVSGLDEWFDLNEEVVVVNDEGEAIEAYEWLLSAEDVRLRVGEKARQRVLKEHTHLHMAKKLYDVIQKLRQ